MSHDTSQPTADEPTDDDIMSLRDRVRENPRPATIWLAGAAVLFILEFGRVMDGVIAFGNAGKFVFGGIAGFPGWLGENIGNSVGLFISFVTGSSADGIAFLVGATASDVMSLVMLFVVATFMQWYVPWRLDDLLGYEMGRSRRLRLERLVLTGVLAVAAVLIAFTPVGGIVNTEIGAWVSVLDALSDIPTLTSRELIPNMGHRTAGGGWEGTFLGLSAAQAWAVRFALVWVYAFVTLAWIWKGYNVYRDHYREMDWTPRDDTLRRFRNHYWGLFGVAVVFGFVVLAAFAPAVSPTPEAEHIKEPYDNKFEHLNEDGKVEMEFHGKANLESRSNGQNTVGPMSYDAYDRWMPLGTTPSGQDMLTHLAYGARTSLIISMSAVTIGLLIAIVLSLMTAYYKGVFDLAVVVASDTIISVPVLVLVMMVVVIFRNHWIAEPLDGGLLLAILLGLAYWPSMWRSIRGPSLQVAEQEWVDAAKSYGQTPGKIMQKHMAPYILSYILIYASLLIGGIIITVAALSFLGLGITPPTPEWGRLINDGQPFIATSSWHISTISGLMIALVVLAFNALGDGIRDAIDPEAGVGETTTAGGGG